MLTCSRCGTCCRKGGPTLRESDLNLLEDLPLRDLMCLRTGEPAFDPRVNAVRPLPGELIKIKGKGDSWECIYYEDGCSIYDRRPMECRALSCTQTKAVLAVMETPALTRAHFIAGGSALGACIAEHEQRFSVAHCMELLSSSAPVISRALDEILREELAFRRALAEKVQASDHDLWAYLGRPLWRILRPVLPELGKYENV